MPEPKEKMMDSNPSADQKAEGFFSAHDPRKVREISPELRTWYRSECQKERNEILSEGFREYDLDSILRDLESDGLFALALAHNMLRSRRKQVAGRN